MNESRAESDLLATELLDVSWPWGLSDDRLDEGVASLVGTPQELSAALDSLRALLRFKERHGDEAGRAIAAIPELDEMYWSLLGPEFNRMMPTMVDLTRANFERWVGEYFNPAWIGESWVTPPGELVDAVGWIWSDGSVSTSLDALLEWIIGQFRHKPDHPSVGDFLDLVAEFTPKVGGYGEVLISVLARAGEGQALPYLRRLADDPQVSQGVRDGAGRYWSWLREQAE